MKHIALRVIRAPWAFKAQFGRHANSDTGPQACGACPCLKPVKLAPCLESPGCDLCSEFEAARQKEAPNPPGLHKTFEAACPKEAPNPPGLHNTFEFTVHQMSSYENDTVVGMGWGNSCMITRRSPDYISARYGRINRPTGEVWLSQESPSGYFIPPGHPNYATAMVFFQSLLHEVLVPLRCATVTELIECQRAALLDQPNKPVYRIPSLETWHHDQSETWHPGSEYPYNRGVFDFDGINHIVVSHGPNATYFAYDDGWEIERCVVS